MVTSYAPLRAADYQGALKYINPKRVKRRLLGFCSSESIRTREEIVRAFTDLPISVQHREVLRRVALCAMSSGHFPYIDGKNITLTRLTEDDSIERYRVRIEDSR